MKIVIATSIFPPDIGGPATYSAKLAEELRQRKFRVAVVSYGESSNAQEDSAVVLVSRKIPKGLRHLLYFFNVLKASLGADMIYAQNATSAGVPAFLTAKFFGKKIIIKIVGDAAWERACVEGLCKDNVEVFQGTKYNWRIEFLRKIQRFITKRAEKIIVPSIYLGNIVAGWGVDKRRIHVIYNAVGNLETEQNIEKDAAKRQIGLDGDIILSVGRLVPWKGFGGLIGVMAGLLEINPAFRLVIVGDGPIEKDLGIMIERAGLEGKVKLVGAMDRARLVLYFASADIFVLNSQYEGLSHVILEAMAYGVPIIATRAGGNPELIEDGRNGFLVNPENPEELREKILELWKNEALQKRFVIDSRKKIKQFGFAKMIRDTLEIITTR